LNSQTRQITGTSPPFGQLLIFTVSDFDNSNGSDRPCTSCRGTSVNSDNNTETSAGLELQSSVVPAILLKVLEHLALLKF